MERPLGAWSGQSLLQHATTAALTIIRNSNKNVINVRVGVGVGGNLTLLILALSKLLLKC